VDDLYAALERRSPGETVKVRVLRDESPLEIEVPLDAPQ
jgi:S1-C subfamily serine protease